MTTTDRRPLAVLALGLALIAAACSASAPSTSGTPSAGGSAPSTAPGGGAGMVDATGDWRLTSGSHAGTPVPIVAGSDITLTVKGSQASGRSACNAYGGEIVVEDGHVKFGPMMSTEMACPDPIMASEAAYLAAMGAVRGATLDGDRLTLTGPGTELVFERIVPDPAAPLIGTTWVLDTVVTGAAASSVMGDPATLQLASDGTITGSTGCRLFSGAYALSGAEVTVTGLATDKRACPPELVAQDELVLAVLSERFTTAVDGRRLEIIGPANQGLGYAVQAAGAPSAS